MNACQPLVENAVHWLVQENQSDSTEVQAILEALEADGYKYHLVPLLKGTAIPTIAGLPDDVSVVCLGPAFVPRALSYPRFQAGIFFDAETFCWSAFHAGWGNAMLASDGRVLPFSAVRAILRQQGLAFIRPDADSKVFDGQIYDPDGLEVATEKTRVTDTTPVVIASPTQIEAEWRFFIVDREVVACSEYRRWGRVSTQGSVPHTAIEFAVAAALRWSPADIYCLDLPSTGTRLGIVEANCFNASRFYGAPVGRILRAVNTHVLSRRQSP